MESPPTFDQSHHAQPRLDARGLSVEAHNATSLELPKATHADRGSAPTPTAIRRAGSRLGDGARRLVRTSGVGFRRGSAVRTVPVVGLGGRVRDERLRVMTFAPFPRETAWTGQQSRARTLSVPCDVAAASLRGDDAGVAQRRRPGVVSEGVPWTGWSGRGQSGPHKTHNLASPACTNTVSYSSCPQESRSIGALQFPGGPSSNRTPTQHELHACVEIPTPAGRQRSGSLGPSPLFPSVRAF